MVTISQVQKGFANFIDRNIAGAFNGWQKAVVLGGATLLCANFPNLVKAYGDHPVVAALGIYDRNGACIDIDALYNAIVPQLGNDKIPLVIPQIGTIKLGREDLDALRRYIKEA